MGRRDRFEDLAGRLDARAPRHAHVHQHHVGRQLAGEFDGLGAVGRLGDHFDLGVFFEHHHETTPEQGVIVTDEDPYPFVHRETAHRLTDLPSTRSSVRAPKSGGMVTG